MRKVAFAFAMLAMMVMCAAVAAAAPTKGNKLQCFSGSTDFPGLYHGTCSFQGNAAVLNTVDNDADPNNAYAGVYIENSNLGGKLLSDVNKLSFSYSGTGATGGSPRISIPIDENGDGTTEGYAFIDTLGCNDGDPNTGTLDAINDPTCAVTYDGVTYPNWAAFVAANPTYRVADDALPFVIIDQPGTFTITNVQLGKGPAKPLR
jgi:opacity protein-like surface antigen